MTNNIKVTVEYTTPKTDAFDALMAQYEEVKRNATETINYYKPLADMAEETKILAILDQIAPIKRYLIQLNKLNSNITEISWYRYSSNGGKCPFEIDLNGNVKWFGRLFNVDMLKHSTYIFTNRNCEDYNILGNWDKWNVYAELEERCISMLKNEIEKRKNEATEQINRLKNITG